MEELGIKVMFFGATLMGVLVAGVIAIGVVSLVMFAATYADPFVIAMTAIFIAFLITMLGAMLVIIGMNNKIKKGK
jgi:ABC-type antimicrobial peptide transport system permease subunit